MDTDEQITAFRDQYDAHRRDTIRRHGWMVTSIMADDEGPGFAYTVGLSGFDDHPELLLVGLPPDVAHAILNAFGDHVRLGGRLRAGDHLRHPVTGLPFQLIAVRDSRAAEMFDADELYATPAGPVPALQLVWSDPRGRLPWEPGYSMAAAAQVLHGSPPRTSTPMELRRADDAEPPVR